MSAFGFGNGRPGLTRSFEEEMQFLTRVDSTSWGIAKGFVPGMRVPGRFYVEYSAY